MPKFRIGICLMSLTIALAACSSPSPQNQLSADEKNQIFLDMNLEDAGISFVEIDREKGTIQFDGASTRWRWLEVSIKNVTVQTRNDGKRHDTFNASLESATSSWLTARSLTILAENEFSRNRWLELLRPVNPPTREMIYPK